MTPATEWAVVHNKGTYFIQPILFTMEGRRLIAQVAATGENSLSAYFTCPESGYMDVIFGSQTQTETVYVS